MEELKIKICKHYTIDRGYYNYSFNLTTDGFEISEVTYYKKSGCVKHPELRASNYTESDIVRRWADEDCSIQTLRIPYHLMDEYYRLISEGEIKKSDRLYEIPGNLF